MALLLRASFVFVAILLAAHAGPVRPAFAGQEIAVELVRPIAFADGLAAGRLTAGEVDALLDRPVATGEGDEAGIELVQPGDQGNAKRVKSCRRYKQLSDQGWTARSDRDRGLEHFFFETCMSLEIVALARPAAHNYVDNPRVSVNDLHLFAPSSWPAATGEQPFRAAGQARRTMADMILEAGTIERTRTGYVSLRYGATRVVLEELARGDFSGDGYQDILVSMTVTGTKGDNEFEFSRLLSRRSPDATFDN